MILSIMLIVLQTAPATTPAPQSWSILTPTDCPVSTDRDIVVCAPTPGSPAAERLPLPDERVSDGPAPTNPNLSARRALDLEGTPCAAMQKGCQVGFGPPIAPIVAGAVGLLKDAFAKKPDKRGRVAIPLDDPAPVVVP
ncbi:hypothetical protein ASE75_04665 [Sphingomonas sp. Leaf17]|uniref:hypothetical protein n=1 Tax=Sphingomonas sp. Leaf17 TaxID=1735683 RepID=UPI000700CF57|nr:hypothetical protein [Sphingomonas sp. Leaf17]KQM65556.1 hypothetical protein ASE75_04665 [Sphingomonas sp. Leaf17]